MHSSLVAFWRQVLQRRAGHRKLVQTLHATALWISADTLTLSKPWAMIICSVTIWVVQLYASVVAVAAAAVSFREYFLWALRAKMFGAP